MEEKLLKQIEQNTRITAEYSRKTANYLGFFVILSCIGIAFSVIGALALTGKI